MIKNLKVLREARGLSQAELAKMIGCTQQSVWKYEHAESEPTLERLSLIARVLGTTVDALIGASDPMPFEIVSDLKRVYLSLSTFEEVAETIDDVERLHLIAECRSSISALLKYLSDAA